MVYVLLFLCVGMSIIAENNAEISNTTPEPVTVETQVISDVQQVVPNHEVTATNTVSEVTEDEIEITKDDIKHAIQNLREQKEKMIAELSALPEDARRELFGQFKQQQGQDDDFGLDAIALKIWYQQYENKANLFANEEERKNFEKAVESGEMVGLHDEKEFAVIRCGNEIILIQSGTERAMQLMEKIAKKFEGKTEKDMNPELIFQFFDTFAAEMKSDFLYDMLFFRLFAKVTKSWVPDILAALKNPAKKKGR